MRRVRFLTSCPPYNAGECGTFSDTDAARLVKNRTAQFDDAEDEMRPGPTPNSKAPAAPPADKMIRDGDSETKGGARRPRPGGRE